MPLLTYTRYVELTGDSTTASAAVEAAIIDAEAEIAEYLRRPLPLGEYTDRLPVDHDGRVYPRAVPVASLPASATSTIEDAITVRWVGGGFWIGTDFLTEWSELYPGRAMVDVTYTGGWTADNAPRKLLRAIARIAWAYATAATTAPSVPDLTTATSVHTGDVSASWDASVLAGDADGRHPLDALAPGVTAALYPLRYVEWTP